MSTTDGLSEGLQLAIQKFGLRRQEGTWEGLSSNELACSAPDCSNMEVFDVSETNLESLKVLGVIPYGGLGSRNIVCISRDSGPLNVKIRLNEKCDNLFFFGPKCNMNATIMVEGSGHLVSIAGGADNARSFDQIMIRGSHNLFAIGAGGSIGRAGIWIEGDHRHIVIGDDPLFSWDVYIRNADGHGIVDLNTAKLINPASSVTIDSHVWIGQNSTVLKGVKIGRGSIIGAGSVVAKSIPSRCAAAGTPARVVRNSVSWTRHANPSSNRISELINSPLI